MKLGRRQLLKVALGASQMALFNGVLLPRRARADATGFPTRLVTIYVPGGWMPTYAFCPLQAADIPNFVPAPAEAENDPAWFVAEQVKNLDGTGDAMDGAFMKLRTPFLWDAANPERAASDRSVTNPLTNQHYNPNGHSWLKYNVFENASVVHGVDQGTASHDSGRISAMCGAAGAEYRAPAIHSVVAHALHARFSNSRPLPCVSIASAPAPNPLSLPSEANPILMQDFGGLRFTVSDQPDSSWKGLRGGRTPQTLTDISGQPLSGTVPVTALEKASLALMKGSNAALGLGSQRMLETLYNGYLGVSSVLARDVVSVLSATKGMEFLDPMGNANAWRVARGTYLYDGPSPWASSFDLALKLLKSELTSSISLELPYGGTFDTHNSAAAGSTFSRMRGVMEVIGRFIGELKMTPISGGGTLLDDTLVLVMSEFSRNWPKSGQDDHWPSTSVIFAGGGVHPNRMVGGYDVAAVNASGTPSGTAVDILEEDGRPSTRVPRSADVITTALRIMGVDNFFIPGGYGEILGLRG